MPRSTSYLSRLAQPTSRRGAPALLSPRWVLAPCCPRQRDGVEPSANPCPGDATPPAASQAIYPEATDPGERRAAPRPSETGRGPGTVARGSEPWARTRIRPPRTHPPRRRCPRSRLRGASPSEPTAPTPPPSGPRFRHECGEQARRAGRCPWHRPCRPAPADPTTGRAGAHATRASSLRRWPHRAARSSRAADSCAGGEPATGDRRPARAGGAVRGAAVHPHRHDRRTRRRTAGFRSGGPTSSATQRIPRPADTAERLTRPAAVFGLAQG